MSFGPGEPGSSTVRRGLGVLPLETPATYRADPIEARSAHHLGLIEGPIAATLLRLAAPNMLVMVVQASLGLIETYFVGWLGTSALAGIANWLVPGGDADADDVGGRGRRRHLIRRSPGRSWQRRGATGRPTARSAVHAVAIGIGFCAGVQPPQRSSAEEPAYDRDGAGHLRRARRRRLT